MKNTSVTSLASIAQWGCRFHSGSSLRVLVSPRQNCQSRRNTQRRTDILYSSTWCCRVLRGWWWRWSACAVRGKGGRKGKTGGGKEDDALFASIYLFEFFIKFTDKSAKLQLPSLWKRYVKIWKVSQSSFWLTLIGFGNIFGSWSSLLPHQTIAMFLNQHSLSIYLHNFIFFKRWRCKKFHSNFSMIIQLLWPKLIIFHIYYFHNSSFTLKWWDNQGTLQNIRQRKDNKSIQNKTKKEGLEIIPSCKSFLSFLRVKTIRHWGG